ncbi:rod shape-determining protein RodA [Ignatzschineria cameli]|uniref:Peptidoglycan glycosyltransferase MrdB n=1 Tax=Ignatzschineria cameli TaxID=2182793 RepID=A0A2U2AQ62_9GAMM|nr:rod shape-determining protein RodA [Ignatzschineria cameli]PWD82899.1 rod shape-determining protein RodA [Ignatzschineria cameli]PWD85747.1 rod shape-determining protein RodA [Ignatzschineria cameli]PWD89376.1 rod shape-determining protein RodA [Ignatzschineria cameli]PWD90848.1 rod shape-determining protein RodA [Ignatzschineria cameli]PWD91636.1 rod shape-determining protein RodA [Ignatzschineria cameli]
MRHEELYHTIEVKPKGLLAFFHLDTVLTFLISMLALFSIAVLWSASNHDTAYITSQALKIIAGFVMMVIIAFIPPERLKQLTPIIYIAALLLLLAVIFIGIEANGAYRWIDLKLFRFQPSEIAKLAVPMMVAYYLHKTKIPPTFLNVIGSLLLIALPVALIFLQPDLGTAIIVLFSGVIVLFLGGLQWRYILIAFGIIAIAIPSLWFFGMKEYQKDRVETFLNPELDPLGKGYQIIQSKIAIGSGGIYGKGWENSTQVSLQFLPEATTDFIYAIIGEEFGLIGSVLLLICYLMIIWRGLYISYYARDSFYQLVGGAVCLVFFFYVFVNTGMVSGVLPVVGVPLPFISYGGTSIMTLFISFGILMNIYSHPASITKRIQ